MVMVIFKKNTWDWSAANGRATEHEQQDRNNQLHDGGDPHRYRHVRIYRIDGRCRNRQPRSIRCAFGIVAFFILQFNKGTLAWADDVVSELRKIVWPSRKDTVAMTVMVCVMLLISGIVLGLYDVIGGTLIDWLLHHNILGLIS